MVSIGSNTIRKIQDYKLSSYACYLIAQNGDSRKKIIALAQTYFAVQTRKMEPTEKEYNELSEDETRLYRRKPTRDGNKIPYGIAKEKSEKNINNHFGVNTKIVTAGPTNKPILDYKII
jgi:DNA-damage-inducible protein D